MRNPKVAAAARLKKRAYREHDRRFLVEGAQGVGEALDEPGRMETLFASDELDPVAVRARHRGVDVVAVSQDVMGKLTSTVTPQGLVGIAPFVDTGLSTLPDDGCIPVLHEIRDPGNAGTVLRSADAAGAGGVVFTAGSVDPYNPKTVRASAGSLFHLPIVRDVGTAEAVEHLRGRGYRVFAMAAEGSEDLFRTDLSGPVAFVFGNEARGLPTGTLSMADTTVRVPIEGKAESLNLAAAAAVCLFEWTRQRTRRGEDLEAIISAAAHDIRSPLTAMKGFGYALEKRWDQMTDEQRTIMLQGIVHDADRMDTIIRQLIDAARVIGGRLELFRERTDLPDLVLSIADQQRRDPDHPGVEWVGTADDALVDPSRLKTTILAFIESLVWWCTDGPIRVDARIDAGRLLVTTSRAGVELTSEQADALFLPRQPGTGSGSKIGLFVARAVAEAQGGRAWGDVDDGRLEFHVELSAEA